MEKPQMFLLDSFAHVDSLLSPLSLFDAHITRLHLHHPIVSHILLLLSLYVTFHIHDSWLLSDTGLHQLLWNAGI